MFLKTKLNQHCSIERVGNTTLPQKNNWSSTLRVEDTYLEDNPTLYKTQMDVTLSTLSLKN